MTTSFCTGLTSDNRRILIKTKVSAAVIVSLFLLNPCLGAETQKEYIYLDGKAVAVDECAYAVSPTGASPASAGGTGSVNVTGSSASCPWTAASNAPSWITINGGGSGTGTGAVGYTVSANTGPARTGTMTIAGETFTVNQANGCAYYNISSPGVSPAAGGSGSVNVTSSDASCTPAITNVPAWVTNVTVSGSGTGKTVGYTVLANTGPVRTGTITISGQTVTVSQSNGCTYGISPTNASPAAAGGTGSVNVTSSNASCPWTAASNAPSWITITGGGSGTGNGTVSYAVSANTGPARSGTVTIAGQTFTVNQANGCTYGISPQSASPAAGGGNSSVSVTSSNAGCLWTAASNAPSWITITGGSSGTGNGTVSYALSANTGSARQGTVTIAGQTFTVNQASGCTYNISPASAGKAPNGGSDSVSVTSGAGCSWTASSNATWITITGGSSGSGNGTVSYTVAANYYGGRSGTATIAGKTFTVTQGSGQACMSQHDTCLSDNQLQCFSQCDYLLEDPLCVYVPSYCADTCYYILQECEAQVQSTCDFYFNFCMSAIP